MWIGGIRCNFLKFDSISGADEPFSMELGMWYYAYYSLLLNTSGLYVFESCNGYPDYTQIDASWKTAQGKFSEGEESLFSVCSFILFAQ